jgi:hypothetical protein
LYFLFIFYPLCLANMLPLGGTYICNLGPLWKGVVNGKDPFGLTIGIKSLSLPPPTSVPCSTPSSNPRRAGPLQRPVAHPLPARIQWLVVFLSPSQAQIRWQRPRIARQRHESKRRGSKWRHSAGASSVQWRQCNSRG